MWGKEQEQLWLLLLVGSCCARGTHGNRLACFAITGPAQAVVGLVGDNCFLRAGDEDRLMEGLLQRMGSPRWILGNLCSQEPSFLFLSTLLVLVLDGP